MPEYQGFCGPSNPAQSPIADCERTVNWYLERGALGDALYPTPGQSLFLTTADLEPRGGISVNSLTYAVIGTGFYELSSNGTSTLRGRVAQDGNPATLHYNGITGGQILICSGTNAYCYTIATTTLTQVLTSEATMGGMVNSRFLAFNKVNGKVRLSALNDGTTWDPTLFFQRSAAADPWQAMVVVGSEIALIGEYTGEFWYDAGTFPQPFALIPGSLFNYGTASTFSVAVVGDYLMWLAKSRNGAGTIVAAKGYTPQPVSNFAVENAIATYERNGQISDCEILAYEQLGHQFACFSFPSARATWCVDLSMQMAWHERGTYDTANGRYNVWGPRVHLYAFNKHLVGNRGSGAIAILDPIYGSEATGDIIRRLRIPPPLYATSRERLTVNRLQVMAEAGLGLTTGQGSDPKVMLRTSRDTKTWGSEMQASAGKLGDYRRRIVWNRLDSSDSLWVPEISVTDPIPWRLTGAEIDGSGFAQGQQRAA
jgi:hypothetical protein